MSKAECGKHDRPIDKFLCKKCGYDVLYAENAKLRNQQKDHEALEIEKHLDTLTKNVPKTLGVDKCAQKDYKALEMHLDAVYDVLGVSYYSSCPIAEYVLEATRPSVDFPYTYKELVEKVIEDSARVPGPRGFEGTPTATWVGRRFVIPKEDAIKLCELMGHDPESGKVE